MLLSLQATGFLLFHSICDIRNLSNSKRVTTVVSVWIISCEIRTVAAVICLTGYAITTMTYVRIYKVVKYHQNQTYGQNQLQNTQTRKVHRQRKSAYNSSFVSVVFLACYFPFFLCTILYKTNTSEISFIIAQIASFFLICLNSSLNPIVYCRRYRKIRQIVKNTVKKIILINENMTYEKTLSSG